MPQPVRELPGASLDLDDAALAALAEQVAELLSRLAESEPFVTAEAAAAHICCPVSRIYALVSARRIPHHRDGSRLLFRLSELDSWIAEGGAKRP